MDIIYEIDDISVFMTMTLFTPPSHLFLTADFTNIESKAIKTLAKRLVDAGCVYFCIWGSDCKRAQGIIDEVGFDVEPAILTTSHPQDTLDKTLSHFAYEIRESKYTEDMRIVAISIGNTASINQTLISYDVMSGV